MKSKDLKRRINVGKRLSAKTTRAIRNRVKRDVLNPLMRHINKLDALNVGDIQVVSDHLLYQSNMNNSVNNSLMRLETRGTDKAGRHFLKQVDNVKRGVKTQRKISFFKGRKSDLKDFNYKDVLKERGLRVRESSR